MWHKWTRQLLPLLAVFLFAGCSLAAPVDIPPNSPSEIPPIVVSVRDLIPTVSMDATVISTPVFLVLSPLIGSVSFLIEPGSIVESGQQVAVVKGKSVVSPVDGVVVGTFIKAGQSIPANLPLVSIKYSGFALEGTPNRWAQSLLFKPDATGRGQVLDAAAPFDCVALVPSLTTVRLPN